MAIEEGVVHRCAPLDIGAAIEQQLDGLVTLTIERREEEDEQAERNATNDKLHVGILVTTEEVLKLVHRLGEVERHKTTHDTQKNHIGNALHRKRVGHSEMEHRVGSCSDV